MAPGMSALNYVFKGYKINSKRRGIRWLLLKSQFLEIVGQKCFYCGTPPSNMVKITSNGQAEYNGMDRVDSDDGYVDWNLVPCCFACNRAKLRMTAEEFMDYLLRAADYIRENRTAMEAQLQSLKDLKMEWQS